MNVIVSGSKQKLQINFKKMCEILWFEDIKSYGTLSWQKVAILLTTKQKCAISFTKVWMLQQKVMILSNFRFSRTRRIFYYNKWWIKLLVRFCVVLRADGWNIETSETSESCKSKHWMFLEKSPQTEIDLWPLEAGFNKETQTPLHMVRSAPTTPLTEPTSWMLKLVWWHHRRSWNGPETITGKRCAGARTGWTYASASGSGSGSDPVRFFMNKLFFLKAIFCCKTAHF